MSRVSAWKKSVSVSQHRGETMFDTDFYRDARDDHLPRQYQRHPQRQKYQSFPFYIWRYKCRICLLSLRAVDESQTDQPPPPPPHLIVIPPPASAFNSISTFHLVALMRWGSLLVLHDVGESSRRTHRDNSTLIPLPSWSHLPLSPRTSCNLANSGINPDKTAERHHRIRLMQGRVAFLHAAVQPSITIFTTSPLRDTFQTLTGATEAIGKHSVKTRRHSISILLNNMPESFPLDETPTCPP